MNMRVCTACNTEQLPTFFITVEITTDMIESICWRCYTTHAKEEHPLPFYKGARRIDPVEEEKKRKKVLNEKRKARARERYKQNKSF